MPHHRNSRALTRHCCVYSHSCHGLPSGISIQRSSVSRLRCVELHLLRCVARCVALRCVASVALLCRYGNTASVQAAARAQQLALTGAGLLGLSEVELMRTFDLSRSEAQVRRAKAKAHHCIAQRSAHNCRLSVGYCSGYFGSTPKTVRTQSALRTNVSLYCYTVCRKESTLQPLCSSHRKKAHWAQQYSH
jgi:hypothetical protein